MTLRSKLIRLAHANPELRAEILPLLKGAAAKGIPVSSQAIRKSYYTASDGVGALVDAVKGEAATKQDAKLLKAVAEADKALGEVYHALRPYAWD